MTDHVTALNQTLSGATCIDLSPVIQNGMPRWVTHPPLVLNATINHDHDGLNIRRVGLALDDPPRCPPSGHRTAPCSPDAGTTGQPHHP